MMIVLTSYKLNTYIITIKATAYTAVPFLSSHRKMRVELSVHCKISKNISITSIIGVTVNSISYIICVLSLKVRYYTNGNQSIFHIKVQWRWSLSRLLLQSQSSALLLGRVNHESTIDLCTYLIIRLR